MDFSPELRGGMIEATLVDLSSRYPVVTTWLLGARLDRAVPAPVTVPATRMIHVPPTWQIQVESMCKNGLSEITAHEFAHALMLASQLDASQGDLTRLPEFDVTDLLTWRDRPSDERSSYLYEPANAVGELVARSLAGGASRSGFGESHLGTYGEADDLEFFAEAMRAYWTHESSDGPLAPIVAEIGSGIDALYLNAASAESPADIHPDL